MSRQQWRDRVEWILVTLGYSVLSALVPVFNAELYLVGLVTQRPELPWWALGLAAAVGQMAGKTVFYFAGREVLRLPAWLRRSSERQHAGRWARWLERFHETSQRRPGWTVGVLLTSAGTGLPPFAAISVLAGMVRVRLATFLVTGLLGRFARFAAVAVSPGLLHTWWF